MTLNFAEHIGSKVKKANQIVGLIFKIFTFMDREMFLNLFKSLVRPHLEYATAIWAPIYKKDAIQIENVQRRATRFVSNLKTLPYPRRLKTLGLPSLEYRRNRADMVQLYKILNGIDQVDKDLLFTMSNNPTREHSLKIFKKRYRLFGRGHFFACGALAASISVGIVIPSTWFVYLYKQTVSITVVVIGTKQFNDKTTHRQQLKTGFV